MGIRDRLRRKKERGPNARGNDNATVDVTSRGRGHYGLGVQKGPSLGPHGETVKSRTSMGNSPGQDASHFHGVIPGTGSTVPKPRKARSQRTETVKKQEK